MNRDRNKPKRETVRLDEKHGQGRETRITPAALERVHDEAAPAWTRRKGAHA